MRRGAVNNDPRFPERRYAVVSAPEVATLGTVILADIDPVAPEGASVLLALPLTDDDPVTGGDGPRPQPLRRGPPRRLPRAPLA